ncbi:MAG TPA: response regulator [Trinickia sp.]|jgi:two-component system cell cycle response regulator CtrA|nr:response regulator [Trinickia sp.]
MNEAQRLERMTVVVIDDDPSSRESLTMMLEAEGARVVAARDAEEGVEAVLSTTPDAVVCDLDLPTMDGFYLIQRLRNDEICSNRPPAVALAITGHTDDAYRLRSIGEGFQHFMTKPAQPARLIALLAEAVGERTAG